MSLMTAVTIVAALLGSDPDVSDGRRTAWYASPQPVWDDAFVLPSGAPSDIEGRTVEQYVRMSLTGHSVRLTLSNRYGRSPVTLREVRLGSSAAQVLFGGRDSIVLAAGEDAESDAIAATVVKGDRVRVAFQVEDAVAVQSFHWDARSTARLTGDQRPSETTTVRLFLSAVTVQPEQACPTVVALGDSLTDGNGVPIDAEVRWTDILADRSGDIAVVNAGISGARLLSNGMGERALDRLESDVLIQPGVEAVIIILGTNDIAWPGSPFSPDDPAMSVDRLQQGYLSLAEAARARGLRVAGATLPPFRGALPGTPMAGSYWTPEKEKTRLTVNAWMRTARPFDHLIDLDVALRDPADSGRLLPAYDSGDHLHPGALGNVAIASAIDLDALLQGQCGFDLEPTP